MARIPNSSPIKAKIKSECASGKFFEGFLQGSDGGHVKVVGGLVQ